MIEILVQLKSKLRGIWCNYNFTHSSCKEYIKKSLEIPKGQSETYIEEEQITQWQIEKVQKDKQQSTKHSYKTKERVTRTPLEIGGELRFPGRVSSSCSTRGTRRVNLVNSYKAGNKSGMRKGPRSVYDKWNISVVICDTDIP